ncbi:MAG: RcpC/CpaB family pilus assembly protein [Chloroflexota bacterium]
MKVGNNRLLLVFALVIVVVVGLVVFVLLSASGSKSPRSTTADLGLAPSSLQTVGPGTVAAPTLVAATPPPLEVPVVVAARALAAGTQLRADDLDTILKPKAEVNEADDITQKEFAINRITKVAYNPNQQIKKSELIEGSFSNYMRQLVADRRLEPGKKAFAYVTNDLSAVAGLIQENDLIDVVATFAVERRPVNVTVNGQTTTIQISGFEVTTKTILQNVRVLKVIKFGLGLAPVTVPRPTSTPGPVVGDTPTPVAVAPPPGTATPLPTVPPFKETGEGFDNSIILVLAVTDQEAEILKFTRESRLTQSVAQVPSLANAVAAQSQTTALSVASDTSKSANFAALTTVPIVHFLLRARPQDTTNPQDPAITLDRTSGATFRVLVRDYGLPIPEVVYATNTQ